jgi:hypothetical protein
MSRNLSNDGGLGGIVPCYGNLNLKVIAGRPDRVTAESIWQRIRCAFPFADFEKEVRLWKYRNLPNLCRGLRTVLLAKSFKMPSIWGELYITKLCGLTGKRLDYGLASLRVVTNNGVAFIVDGFQNSVELEIMKYHGLGTGTGNEAATDSALGTELTTEYATDNARATGTSEEGATANIFKTIATNTLKSGTPAITEHGIFSQAANSGLQSTYQFTLTAGS